jgi:polar amino acid transport system permease protein
VEAGYALGLHKGQVFRFIVLKPASLTGQFIMLTLTSSICSAVSAYELTSVAQRIESDTFRSFEVYFSVTFLYLAISWLLMLGFAVISHRFFSYPTR